MQLTCFLFCLTYNTIRYKPKIIFHRWETSIWGECSKTCGDGEEVRGVTCKILTRGGDVEVNESECDTLQKPEVKRKCQEKKCPPVWYMGPWSKVGSRVATIFINYILRDPDNTKILLYKLFFLSLVANLHV